MYKTIFETKKQQPIVHSQHVITNLATKAIRVVTSSASAAHDLELVQGELARAVCVRLQEEVLERLEVLLELRLLLRYLVPGESTESG